MSGKLTDHVGKDKKVYFLHYQDNTLWYRTESGLEYPVPCQDTGSGIFLPEDRSIYHMRWIRKHLDFLEQSRIDQDKNNS